ncbi:MAG: tetratricopeptide repeat protein [Pseudomonadales bacterium]|nr:tetratricopeptide repeat protein [Pseudomonadales bacterium]MCP5189902.1 tetratricopeptide repeat protein [Pseudomonadales bacterium]MCP5203626.1 tetratricopeptide repeat protein [Pseudomonadales bacterium]
MEAYRTEEEQVEALRRWWQENGRTTVVAVVVALGIGFGWQGWKHYNQERSEGASDLYQRMLQAYSVPALSGEQQEVAAQLAQQLKTEYEGSSYSQFAALQLASTAVIENDLSAAEGELRWVLARADVGGDIARITQVRLARVLAAQGQQEQALAILDEADAGPYQASYALARGDILSSMGREQQALEAYRAARSLATADGQINLRSLEQKLQALGSITAGGATDGSVAGEGD